MNTTFIHPLDWDTNHFGFPIGKIDTAIRTDEELNNALKKAQSSGMRLVYLMRSPENPPAADLLRRFSGTLVDTKVVFGRSLLEVPQRKLSSENQVFNVVKLPPGEPSPSVLSLAISAGEYSRFKLDSRIPSPLFESLYTKWIKKCALRTSDGAIHAAQTSEGKIIGIIASELVGKNAKIEIVAVNKEYRGLGVASSLLSEVHDWMRVKGAESSTVATQMENTVACRLYSSTGYQLKEQTAVYHFWI